MGLICIGDVVVTPDGMGDVVDMNARKAMVMVELQKHMPSPWMRWYPMAKVTLVEDLPDFSDPDAVEAYLASDSSANNKPFPDAATIDCCSCSCGRKGNCGKMSTNGFHTPMNSSCQCIPLDCTCAW